MREDQGGGLAGVGTEERKKGAAVGDERDGGAKRRRYAFDNTIYGRERWRINFYGDQVLHCLIYPWPASMLHAILCTVNARGTVTWVAAAPWRVPRNTWLLNAQCSPRFNRTILVRVSVNLVTLSPASGRLRGGQGALKRCTGRV